MLNIWAKTMASTTTTTTTMILRPLMPAIAATMRPAITVRAGLAAMSTKTTTSTTRGLVSLAHRAHSQSLTPQPRIATVSLVNHIQRRLKTDDRPRAVELRNRKKVASVRKGKYYKLKNHKGAVARWLLVGRGIGTFKRKQAAHNHLNRKEPAWKSKRKRRRVFANGVQRKLLKQLIPYWRKKYMR